MPPKTMAAAQTSMPQPEQPPQAWGQEQAAEKMDFEAKFTEISERHKGAMGRWRTGYLQIMDIEVEISEMEKEADALCAAWAANNNHSLEGSFGCGAAPGGGSTWTPGHGLGGNTSSTNQRYRTRTRHGKGKGKGNAAGGGSGGGDTGDVGGASDSGGGRHGHEG
ncbi:hypothetical protein ColTof4_14346 [Colletotrichum tofieldiae]|nr:hypothetical protein ColTof3_14757 [Colletotrichum tofieldiae]GKT81923.1 hypothetical protein ColTof4_14346 [Colletotrichum tofieldiae]